ncbi:hypothetical protein B296_00000679 [Ensete ventricosum]|uniref:Clathrin/coatomer adaptor adaptin-like N-terminal domain-containing protein n=1 Tax=Ensete ventricosum TaxID=4639 RepID=A0A427B1D6_ENSVE|nr:hypothetical protein B296_00000679 [Ensete ventricosum]
MIIKYSSQVAITHPLSVTNCNVDMESLISDQNRSIATLAITTLLKTGNESSVDRMMKQITNFMSDIADEFKIVVVEAIRSLCLKFPLKYRSLYILHFIGNEGPKTTDPSKYIRYIYNRVILENATVRASAVSTLAKFGAMVDSLKVFHILVVLKVTVFVDASEAEDFSEVASKPLRSLPYDSPGQTFVAFEKPYGLPATGRFSNLLKFFVKEV